MLRRLALDDASFVQLTLKGALRGQDPGWRMLVVRPVLVKNQRHLQFSYYDAKRDITKNFRAAEAEAKLDEALALPFSSLHLRSTVEDVHVQITQKGKAILHHSAPTADTPDLAHDSSKDLPIPADHPDPMLQKLGIMNQRGEIRPSMQGKFSQINEFLKLLEHTGELDRFEQSPIHILDCGCGSSYLTFALYHYLNHLRGIRATLAGIDLNAELMDRSNAQSAELGFPDVCFYPSRIIDYVPEVPPDILVALHACDTATDEAIVQGIRCGARLILCTPCCHHHLNEQLTAVAPFKPVLRHGILKQRMADILTDSFRALALRIMGYKTDVIEFISSEHTDRNLMIRAVKRASVGERAFVEEYNDLMAFWGVTPYIETLLGEDFAGLLR